MKTKILILAMAILFSLNVSGQGMPVYDNTNFISLAKSLIESAKQTSQLLKTVEFLKKQKENLEKVASVVQQLRAVEEIAQNNQRLYGIVQNDLQEILNSQYIKPNEVTKISNSFNSIIQSSMDDLNFIDKILSSDFLKMTDAERTQLLQEKEMKSKEMVAEITKKTERYRDIISFRKMQDKINNRETDY
ncbi:conjugal transfer protein [Subsaxibacter sp. CAU 1640]|uniref:conjugal transfer protein n=1 Tax=Subsaxibacter sp. CAU 1640 TaxID=2933271 RepID=UPI002002D222|nr:conjugal transfer protein [Subsaxibacter sp. CAU 1640]MCK7591333.1 conjugal transfer protein [Subsaxibacter sp. CAU 1640]